MNKMFVSLKTRIWTIRFCVEHANQYHANSSYKLREVNYHIYAMNGLYILLLLNNNSNIDNYYTPDLFDI